jgi:hypothetical protein
VSPIPITLGAILVALGTSPREDVARDSVDLIEINHFYDEQGRLVFDQVIFYDWSSADARYMVRAWRLVKNPGQLPQRDWKSGGYVAVWQDSGQGGEVLRHVQSQSIRETWTQYDPELVEREYLPKERRKELRAARLARSGPTGGSPRAPAPPQPRTETPEPTSTAAVTR